MKRLILLLIIHGLVLENAINQVSGHVYELNGQNTKTPLVGASVYWKSTTISAMTGPDGEFTLEGTQKSNALITSFIGYKTDTLVWSKDDSKKPIEILLKPSVTQIMDVVKTVRQKGETFSKVNPIYTKSITSAGLKKAACCNLAESFQNSSSVDVTYSDAVTGVRQIQMLGLAGVYTQLLTENIPNMRGLANNYGLLFIPGSWLESIQISKGVSSVRNGFEAISGQINTEFKKPEQGERLFVNGFVDSEKRFELNSDASVKVNDKWGTMLFIHANKMDNKLDMNNDKFIDQPLFTQYNIYNRWKYTGDNFQSQFGIKYLNEDRNAGQLTFDSSLPRDTNNGFGIGIKTQRVELYNKTAYISPGRPNTSVALIISATKHNQKSFYGLNNYKAGQNSLYSNLIFITYIGNTDHTIATGVSFVSDWYTELLNNSEFDRNEIIPGIYTEYTYKPSEVITTIAGIRADKSSKYGAFITPRAHLKYNPISDVSIRLSAGKGYRSPSPIAENTFLLASSKQISFLEDIKLEKAWNYGLSVTWQPENSIRKLNISAEYFRTDFQNQLIVDVEKDISKILFYNLRGKSYSNSFQVESSLELLKNLNLSVAYKLNDVKITINEKLKQKPLINRDKALLTVDYVTPRNKWQINYTLQFNGGGRLPDTQLSESNFVLNRKFPSYFLMHAQVTYKFKKFDFYIGGENLTGYVQNNPILAADSPYSKFFDASQVWAPLSGAMFYGGFRFILGSI
jgi:outer membrane receptor for ferrienterochelin and colicins